MDQDRYEATGFAYRLRDKVGYHDAPAFLIERVKIDGQWREGPVICNPYAGWDSEALAYGLEEVTDDQEEMYRTVRDELISRAGPNGEWERIAPVEIDAKRAPCKEVIQAGNDVDLLKFAWITNNPTDVGPYVSMGSFFFVHPEYGRNVGTYRCQIKGPQKIGVNPERGQDLWRFFMDLKQRGETSAKVSIAFAVDPITFTLSSSKITRFGEDELEVAGALHGKPIELVKSETNDILVPAHAEMIIEGTVPLTEMEPEGPYGEMYGYMGPRKEENFFMNIEAITHRCDPLIVNCFTGILKGYHRAPSDASELLTFKKMIPGLTDIHSLADATGVTILSIDKRFPGDGITAGQQVAAGKFSAKVVIVVDKDINVLDMSQVMHTLGSRWQPDPATQIILRTRGVGLDPSAPVRGMTSKIIIDATRQLPQEGGPETFPPVSRVLLEEGAADVFDLVDSKWTEYWADTIR
jgi:UbiD family decarboxylase